jgi:hypothetical protein
MLKLITRATAISVSVVVHAAAQGTTAASTAPTISYRSASATPIATVNPRSRAELVAAGLELSNVAAVLRQHNGSIVVLSRTSPSLTIVSSQGVTAAFGRSGMGPGEFEDANSAAVLPGDSLAVSDNMLRRITIFAPTGRYVRSFSVEPPFPTGPYEILVNALADGTLLVSFVEAPAPTAPEYRGAVETVRHVVRYTATGRRVATLGRYFHSEHFRQQTRSGPAFWDRSFGRRGVLLTDGNTYLVGDATEHPLQRIDTRGRIAEQHDHGSLRPRVLPAEIDRYRREAMALSKPADRSTEEARVSQMPFPTHYPAYRRALLDDRRRIWLEMYPTPLNRRAEWCVLDPAQRRAQRIVLPNAFVPAIIFGTTMVGIRTDSDGVETLVSFQFAT